MLSRFYSPCNHVNGRNVLHEASREHTKKRHNFVCSVVPSTPAVLSAFTMCFSFPRAETRNQKVFFIAFNFSRCFFYDSWCKTWPETIWQDCFTQFIESIQLIQFWVTAFRLNKFTIIRSHRRWEFSRQRSNISALVHSVVNELHWLLSALGVACVLRHTPNWLHQWGYLTRNVVKLFTWNFHSVQNLCVLHISMPHA